MNRLFTDLLGWLRQLRTKRLVFDTLTIRLLFLLWIVLLIPMTALMLFVSQLMTQILQDTLDRQAQSSMALAHSQLTQTEDHLQAYLDRHRSTLTSATEQDHYFRQLCQIERHLSCGILATNGWQPVGSKSQVFSDKQQELWTVQRLKGNPVNDFYQVDEKGHLRYWIPIVLPDHRVWLIGQPVIPLLRHQLQTLNLPPASQIALYQPEKGQPLLNLSFTDPGIQPSKPSPRPSQKNAVSSKNREVSYQQLLMGLDQRPVAILRVSTPVSLVSETLHLFYLGAYSIFVIGLFCSMGLAFLASRSVIAPIYQMIAQMEQASRNILSLRDTPKALTIDGVHEVRRLVAGFNQLLTRLGEEYRLRDEFVATLTHDLKVPLLAERQTLQYLSNELFGPLTAEQGQVLATMTQTNQEVLRLVNSLLEVYRYDSAQVKLQQAVIPLDPLIQAVVSSLEPLRLQKDQTLVWADDYDPTVSAYVDGLEIRRVLQNLLANALAYTPRHGRITIRLVSGDHLRQEPSMRLTDKDWSTLKRPVRLAGYSLLSIEDGGIGFDRQQLAQAFQRFSSRRGHDPMSLGLGLYHSYQVVDTHGGTIWIETTEGDGSVIQMLLPATAAIWQQGERYHDRRNQRGPGTPGGR